MKISQNITTLISEEIKLLEEFLNTQANCGKTHFMKGEKVIWENTEFDFDEELVFLPNENYFYFVPPNFNISSSDSLKAMQGYAIIKSVLKPRQALTHKQKVDINMRSATATSRVRNERVSRIIIDSPLSLDEEQAKIFYKFIKSLNLKKPTVFLNYELSNDFSVGHQSYEFEGTYINFETSMLLCPCQHEGEYKAYTLENSSLGSKFSPLYSIATDVSIRSNAFLSEIPIRPQVVKLKNNGHISPTEGTTPSNTIIYKFDFNIMDKIPGKSLDIILNSNTLTLAQRFELTNCLIKALKEQVTDQNHVHGRISPRKIMVDFDHPIKVTIIKRPEMWQIDSHPKFLHLSGDRFHQAPETLLDNSTFVLDSKIDVYSLGRVLQVLWGDPRLKELEMYYSKCPYTLEAHYKQLAKSPQEEARDLFLGLPEGDEKNFLSEIEIDTDLKLLIMGMIEFNPEKRFDIDQVEQRYTQIYNQYIREDAKQKPKLQRDSEAQATMRQAAGATLAIHDSSTKPSTTSASQPIPVKIKGNFAKVTLVASLLMGVAGMAIMLTGVLAPIGAALLVLAAVIAIGVSLHIKANPISHLFFDRGRFIMNTSFTPNEQVTPR